MLNRDQITNKKDLLRDSLQNQGKRTVAPKVSKIKVESMGINKTLILIVAMKITNCKLNQWKIVIRLKTVKRVTMVTIRMIATQKLN